MLRDVRIPRRILVPFTLACLLLLTFVPGTSATPAIQAPQIIGPSLHSLALGDSLAFGFQPNGDFTHGYNNDLFTYLQSQGVQDHQNLSCPGETSTTFRFGGSDKCPAYQSPSSAQLSTAVNYLKEHAG